MQDGNASNSILGGQVKQIRQDQSRGQLAEVI